MNKLNKIREWANRDNGHVLKIGNRKLNLFEALGFLCVLLAVVIFVVHSKLGLGANWMGWSAFIVGAILVAVGSPDANKNAEF